MKKKRIPKPIKIPIMRSTIDMLALEMRLGILTAQVGYFSEKNFKRIASIVNLVSVALQGKEVDRAIEASIDGCIRCMNEIDATAVKTGKWVVSDWQLLTIEAGVQKIEEVLPRLTINDLRKAQDILAVIELERISNVS